MLRSHTIFNSYTTKDENFLKLMAIACKSSSPESINKARAQIVKLPDEALLYFFCRSPTNASHQKNLQDIYQFCCDDKVLQAHWKSLLQKKKYISESVPTQSGKVQALFDHHLGHLNYSAINNKSFVVDKLNSANLACQYRNYHGILFRCQIILRQEFNKPEISKKVRDEFISLIESLGDNFWSLGHLQAGCFLNQSKQIFEKIKNPSQEDILFLQQQKDLILSQFLKAEAEIDTEQSQSIFSAIRGEQTLPEFLNAIFGVDSIEKVKDIFKNQTSAENYQIIADRSYQEIIAKLSESIELESSDDSDNDEKDNNDVNKIEARLKKATDESQLIGALIKNTFRPKIRDEIAENNTPLKNATHQEAIFKK